MGEKVAPVVHPPADQGKFLGPSILNVSCNVPTVLRDPPDHDSPGMPVATLDEVAEKHHRDDQLKERATQELSNSPGAASGSGLK